MNSECQRKNRQGKVNEHSEGDGLKRVYCGARNIMREANKLRA